MQIVNDTEYSITIEMKRTDSKNIRKETILPGDNFGFGFIGPQPPSGGKEAIEKIIKEYCSDGFYITYLENIYHFAPDVVAELMVNNAKYDEKRRIYYLNVSEFPIIKYKERK